MAALRRFPVRGGLRVGCVSGTALPLGKEAPAAAGCKARTWGDGVPSPGQPPASAKADTDPQPPHLTDFGMLPWALASCPARPSVAAHQAGKGGHSGVAPSRLCPTLERAVRGHIVFATRLGGRATPLGDIIAMWDDRWAEQWAKATPNISLCPSVLFRERNVCQSSPSPLCS